MANNVDNDITNALTSLDQTLSSKGPVARWQRKALNSSCNNSVLSSSLSGIPGTKRPINSSSYLANNKRLNLSESLSRSSPTKKTPSKSPGRTLTPGSNRKTPGSNRKTPSKLDGADRFIPSRTAIDFETSRFLLQQRSDLNSQAATMSPSKLQFQKQMEENLCGTDMDRCKIISYRNKAPINSEGHPNGLKVLYTQNHSPAVKKANIRHIPQAPDRILDAPDIVNDYYLNLLDWSCNNHLAVALGPHIYLWNAANGKKKKICFASSCVF